MENITNKTLLTTMIIIGVVIALMIIPLYPKSYISSRNLGANVFDSVVSTNQNNANLGIYMNTNYGVSAFRTSNTRTITETSSAPTTTTKTYYYSTYDNTASLPDETGYYGGDYVPAGCESGTDYSLTTGEPCG
jgi:hypothetical protein